MMVPARSVAGTRSRGLRSPSARRTGTADRPTGATPRVQPRGLHPDQHLVVSDLRSGDRRQAQDSGGAVPVLHHRHIRAARRRTGDVDLGGLSFLSSDRHDQLLSLSTPLHHHALTPPRCRVLGPGHPHPQSTVPSATRLVMPIHPIHTDAGVDVPPGLLVPVPPAERHKGVSPEAVANRDLDGFLQLRHLKQLVEDPSAP